MYYIYSVVRFDAFFSFQEVFFEAHRFTCWHLLTSFTLMDFPASSQEMPDGSITPISEWPITSTNNSDSESNHEMKYDKFASVGMKRKRGLKIISDKREIRPSAPYSNSHQIQTQHNKVQDMSAQTRVARWWRKNKHNTNTGTMPISTNPNTMLLWITR